MSAEAASTSGLLERLGPGARFDDPAAPADDLTDEELTALGGQGSPSRVVAETGYEARALAQIVEWARSGITDPGTDPFATVPEDVDLAATLPAEALRNLFRHSEVHLNVEWRDCDALAWASAVRLPGGRTVAISDTARIRAVSIWRRALRLGRESSLREAPAALAGALAADPASSPIPTTLE